MTQLLIRLWNDQGGFILSTEATILWTITVLGTVAGLAAVRDAAVSEHVEMANTIRTFDQSYSYSGVQVTNGVTGASIAQTNGSAATNLVGGPNGASWYGLSSTGAVVVSNTQPNIISISVP